MLAVYLALTLLALLLLLALLRTGAVRPMTVWLLATLLPLLAALTAALNTQAQAQRTLKTYQPDDVAVVLKTAGREYDVVLNARQAACLERTLRLRTKVNLTLPNEADPVPLRPGTRAIGDLPKPRHVDALGIRGQLSCPEFRAMPSDKAGEK